MTRLLFTLALALAAAISSAQPTQTQQDELQQRLSNVAERLELTDEQKVQIEPIITESFARQQQVLAKYGIDPGASGSSRSRPSPRTMRKLRSDMQGVRSSTREQLDGILSDAQMQEYARLQEEMQAQMRSKVRGSR
ncbi:MAG: hypothetical protein AAGA68_05230 [Pseudomonadota bacterium]